MESQRKHKKSEQKPEKYEKNKSEHECECDCSHSCEKQETQTRQTENATENTIRELKELLQRTAAEFHNYRKRTEQDKSKFITLANESLIKKILPTIDNLELALQHNQQKNEFTEGIQMIYAQLLETLEQEGLTKINAQGKFKPELHEAILTQETQEEPGIIIQELQKGYMIGDRVIRHAKVKITKKIMQTKEVQEKNETNEIKQSKQNNQGGN